jgi:hypothetical protein
MPVFTGMTLWLCDIRRYPIKRGSDVKKADFRTFYRDAHAVECLTEREKMLIGITVAMMRLCDP